MEQQFGTDLMTIIRDLTRRLEKLEAGQRAGPGLNVGQASGPFLVPSTSTPSTPGSGAYLYTSGSTLRWRSTSGDYSLIPTPPPSPASAPNWPESFDSPASIVSPPSASDYNLLRADTAGLHNDLRSVILRGVQYGAWLDPS
ncbi:hypothetical protein [Nonomuraea dietziae]|uniref:hypothetical protein n=1 Tax=Nonomuraea dietziae TaxID=65515 RepID=UPI003404BE22